MASTYPVTVDLYRRIIDMGVLAEDTLTELSGRWDLESKRNAAVAAWERESGWHPFVSTGVDSTRYFDAPESKYLELSAGLLSVTTVLTGYSLTSAGTVQTVNDDFYLEERGAPDRGWPYTALRFGAFQSGDPRSIVVTGKWGFCAVDSFPDDAFDAILDDALCRCYGQLALAVSRGVASIRDLSSSVDYGGGKGGPFSGAQDAWRKNWQRTAEQFKRPSI